ncbi:cytochrome c-type biogenesis protein [Aquabacterium sp.]|uniref:cytochrome c-type biogenesis protein n=1 Tax=Aquabacterium sp. TaxID=1872578 RepID=UPI002C7F902E|nr:cytochrome c-type biogenesis protein [Aquabacterium sp.]HSW07019.1 cytochrome c-type biogenesis protein [Aquabacterium sp.]
MAERRTLRTLLLGAVLGLAVITGPARAADAPPATDNPAREARMMALAAELRCLVCQNQTIADSHAGLAEDLRRQIRELLDKGMSDREIRDYMTQRYGDFVLYRPPFKASTALLWAGPGLLLVGALGGLALVLRRRQRLGDEAFDPDVPEEQETNANVPNR